MLMESETHKTPDSEASRLGEGVKFERIRRITGYLVGTLDRFNDAKRREEADRIKHVWEPFSESLAAGTEKDDLGQLL